MRLSGLLLAVIALISQLALGAMVLPDSAAAAPAARVDALSILCVAGTPAHPPASPAHHSHKADWAVCPLNVSLALPMVMLAPASALPAPSAATIVHYALPPGARAPPSYPPRPGFSRGPPRLT